MIVMQGRVRNGVTWANIKQSPTVFRQFGMLLKRGMGNGEWGMGNGEWGMGNGEWEIENGKWEIENGKLIFSH